jgi:hypothetical protein
MRIREYQSTRGLKLCGLFQSKGLSNGFQVRIGFFKHCIPSEEEEEEEQKKQRKKKRNKEPANQSRSFRAAEKRSCDTEAINSAVTKHARTHC